MAVDIHNPHALHKHHHALSRVYPRIRIPSRYQWLHSLFIYKNALLLSGLMAARAVRAVRAVRPASAASSCCPCTKKHLPFSLSHSLSRSRSPFSHQFLSQEFSCFTIVLHTTSIFYFDQLIVVHRARRVSAHTRIAFRSRPNILVVSLYLLICFHRFVNPQLVNAFLLCVKYE